MDKLDFSVGNIEASLTYNPKNNNVWVVIKRGKNEMALSFKSMERLETFALRLYEASMELWLKTMLNEKTNAELSEEVKT